MGFAKRISAFIMNIFRWYVQKFSGMKIKSAEDRNNGEGKEENDWRMKSYFNVAKKRRK